MCVKSCICNSCYKKNTCSDCNYINDHNEVDCRTDGITKCDSYIEKINIGAIGMGKSPLYETIRKQICNMYGVPEELIQGIKTKGPLIGYTGEECTECGRLRVELWGNGDKICEKCNWNQDKKEYEFVTI
jgi:hypothetical protein